MLHVEKENLIAETVKEVAALRDMEFRFYIDHIGSIQTMATLIAGFSFTALISTDSIKLDLNAVLFQDDTGVSMQEVVNATTGTTLTTPLYGYPGPIAFFSLFMHVGEMAAVIASLGQMLTVITESLIARLLGARLALRGPDGSIIRSTRHLATALASSTRGFFNGLQFFILACFFHVLRGQHPIVSTFLVCILYPFWRHQGTLADELSKKFHLVHGVTTAFTVVPPKSMTTPRRNSIRRRLSSDRDARVDPIMSPVVAATRNDSRRSDSRRGDLGNAFRAAVVRASSGGFNREGSRDSHSEEAVQAWRERRRLSTSTPKKSATQSHLLTEKHLPSMASRPSVQLPTPQPFPPPNDGDDAHRACTDTPNGPAKGRPGCNALRAALPSGRDLRRRVGSLTHSSLGKLRAAKSSMANSGTGATESPQQSARSAEDKMAGMHWFRRFLGRAYHWINPVSHRLHYLFEQVSEDFEGEGATANKAHKTPTAATSHLISTTESEQIQKIHNDFEVMNQQHQHTTEALSLQGGVQGALKLLDLWA